MKVERERGRVKGKDKYRELRKGQGRKVEGEGKKKVWGRSKARAVSGGGWQSITPP